MAHGITKHNGIYQAARKTGTLPSWHKKEWVSDNPTTDIIRRLYHTEEATYTTGGILTPSRALIVNVVDGDNVTQYLTGMVGKNYQTQSLDQVQRRCDMLEEAGLTPNFAAWLHGFGMLMLTFKVAEFNVAGHDKHETHLTMACRYDYKGNDLLLVSGVRVVCQNTMWQAEAVAKNLRSLYKIRHTGDIDGKAEKATKTLLGMDRDLGAAYASAIEQQAQYSAIFNQLAATAVTGREVNEMTKQLFSERKTAKPEEYTAQAIKNQDMVIERMNNEESTKFGWLNAVTETTKVLPVRMVSGMTDDDRVGAQFTNDFFGAGQGVRTKAMSILCA